MIQAFFFFIPLGQKRKKKENGGKLKGEKRKKAFSPNGFYVNEMEIQQGGNFLAFFFLYPMRLCIHTVLIIYEQKGI